jgi:Hypothetical protein (DUF2513).
MKLNYDCIRSLLLALEENLNYDDSLSLSQVRLSQIVSSEILGEFTKEDIAYSSLKLLEAEYIEARIIGSDQKIIDIVYFKIIFAGHQYIDTIRDNKVWKKVMNKIGETTSSIALDVITEVAKSFLLGVIFPNQTS